MYSSGFMDTRVKVLRRQSPQTDGGVLQGGDYAEACVIWASVTWAKGKKALNNGTLEAYDTLMVRCRCCRYLDRFCRLSIDGKVYEIATYNSDYRRNEVQITCYELINT